MHAVKKNSNGESNLDACIQNYFSTVKNKKKRERKKFYEAYVSVLFHIAAPYCVDLALRCTASGTCLRLKTRSRYPTYTPFDRLSPLSPFQNMRGHWAVGARAVHVISQGGVMEGIHLWIRGRIRAGGNWILEPGGEIDSSLAESLNQYGAHIQIFRHVMSDFATRLQNPL